MRKKCGQLVLYSGLLSFPSPSAAPPISQSKPRPGRIIADLLNLRAKSYLQIPFMTSTFKLHIPADCDRGGEMKRHRPTMAKSNGDRQGHGPEYVNSLQSLCRHYPVLLSLFVGCATGSDREGHNTNFLTEMSGKQTDDLH